MIKNDCTVSELQELIKEMASKKDPWSIIDEDELREKNLHFIATPIFRYEHTESYDGYFLCTDGLGRVKMDKNLKTNTFYIHVQNTWFIKLDNDHLEEIAERYQKVDEKIEELLKEKEIL